MKNSVMSTIQDSLTGQEFSMITSSLLQSLRIACSFTAFPSVRIAGMGTIFYRLTLSSAHCLSPKPTPGEYSLDNTQHMLEVARGRWTTYLIRRKEFLAKTEVSKYNMSIRIKQYVLQFDVTVYDAQLKQCTHVKINFS